MSRLARLQLVGPIFLFIAVAGAEGAARALAHAPGSEALWYIHLGVFGPFRLGDDVLGTYVNMAHGQLYLIELPLFLIACSGAYSKRRLALAVASNLCLVHAVFLAYASCAREPARIALVAGVADMIAPHVYLCAGMLGAALLSFAASHIIYLRAICQEHG